MSDLWNELEQVAAGELRDLMDKNKQEMLRQDVRNEITLVASFSDEQLSGLLRIIGFRQGLNKVSFSAGLRRFAGVMYLEQMRRNTAKQFAKLLAPTDGLPGGEYVGS